MKTERAMVPGQISISRTGHDEIFIEIRDERSGKRFLEVTMTPEVFGLVVTGLGYQNCMFELDNLEYVGKDREFKEETVQTTSYPHPEHRQTLAAPYEVDGWQYSNGNTQGKIVRVGDVYHVKLGFQRWIDSVNPDQEERQIE